MDQVRKVLFFIRRELMGWRPGELIWMFLAVGSILALSIYWEDTFWGIISAVTGMLYTLFAGKGKISAYLFGIVNCVLYGYLALQNGYFGDMTLYWIYYLPMMFAGIYCWRGNMKQDHLEIIKTKLTGFGRLILFALCLFGVMGGWFVLHHYGGNRPLADSITTMISIAAMVMTVKRCIEQWILWTIANTVEIFMWFRVFQTGGGSISTLIMWTLFFINGIILYLQWLHDLKKEDDFSNKNITLSEESLSEESA